jgi:Tfp pilus assembly protein FimT
MGRIGQKGFSIVEIVIGLQLFTVLALIAAPNVYQTMQSYRLRAAVREVYSDLQNARMGAVVENHRYRFVVVDAQTYQLHDDTNNNGAIDTGESVTTRRISNDAPGATLSATSAITFLPDGTALASATVTVVKNSRTVNVVVSAGGRVRVSAPTS